MMAHAIHPHQFSAEPQPTPTTEWGDSQLIAALRRGDEAAFMLLVERYHASLIRLARLYLASDTSAEEVAQETWLAVLQGLEHVESQTSLRAWIFGLLISRARIRAQREGRSVPVFRQLNDQKETLKPAVDPQRFNATEPGKAHWASSPQDWASMPEERIRSAETHNHMNSAIAALALEQRLVLILRDVEGLTAPEVCAILEVSEVQQRALLHQARSRVRAALEQFLN